MSSPEPASGRGQRTSVLLAAGAAPWEGRAVTALSTPGKGIWLQRRCLDLTDLLGAAATRTAQVAVVSSHLAGLDADSVGRLHREQLRVLAVLDERSSDPPTALA